FGAGIDDSLDDEVRITVIATGFEKTPFPKKEEIKKKSGSERDWTRSYAAENAGRSGSYGANGLSGTPLVHQD
ncbi:MAG: cell division protein FtsZ, partial [Clostridia bacterium]